MDFFTHFLNKNAPLSKESLEDFKTIFHRKKYNKKEIIIQSGDTHSKTYILEQGLVRSYVIDKNGRENIRSILTSGDALTSLPSVVNKVPSASTFDCLTEVYIYQANFEEFIRMTKKHHDIAVLYNRVLEKAFNNLEHKVTALTTLDATERYLDLKKRAPNIEQLIPLNQIASYLNITPIQFSRIRKKLYSN